MAIRIYTDLCDDAVAVHEPIFSLEFFERRIYIHLEQGLVIAVRRRASLLEGTATTTPVSASGREKNGWLPVYRITRRLQP